MRTPTKRWTWAVAGAAVALVGVLATPFVVAADAATATTVPAARLETWADRSLPVGQGLALWLDATRQPTAWQAHGKPALGNGAPLDVWYNGSGHGRHLTQPAKGAQPRFVAAGGGKADRKRGEWGRGVV